MTNKRNFESKTFYKYKRRSMLGNRVLELEDFGERRMIPSIYLIVTLTMGSKINSSTVEGMRKVFDLSLIHISEPTRPY